MKIGFAKIDITPPAGTLLCGQLVPLKAEGTESRLFATSMCVECSGRKTVFVGCDILMITNEFAREIADESPVDVIIASTHTHSGPQTVDIFGGSANIDYIRRLKKSILQCIRKSSESLREGALYYCRDVLEGYAFNRRFIMNDGTVETHPLKGDPHIVRPEGPDSNDIHLIYARSGDDSLIGCMVVFGCHATAMERSNPLISSDFPGKAVEFLEDRLGVPCLYMQSACGNICQVNPLDVSRREVGREWAVSMGHRIGEKAMEMLNTRAGSPGKGLGIFSETVMLPRRKIPADLLEWAERHREIIADVPVLSDYGSEPYNQLPEGVVSLEGLFKTPFWANFYASEIRIRNRDFLREPEMPLAVKIAVTGDTAIVTLPCELFVEVQNRIIEESPFEDTVVIELANGWNGYIPAKGAFERAGGYETKEVTSTMLVSEAEDILVSHVRKMLEYAYEKGEEKI